MAESKLGFVQRLRFALFRRKFGNFDVHGLNIIAAFDNDPSKIGTVINGIEVLPIEKLEEMIESMKVQVGVITATPESAQSIAETMVKAGIKAIWNFAPTNLKLSKKVVIENTILSYSLAVLTYKLSQ